MSRRTAFPILLALLALSCSDGITGPDTGTGGSPGEFNLLVERRDAGGVRFYYTIGALSGYLSPFTGVPVDATTLVPSPDGRTIAYLRTVPGGFVRLWAMDRDGSNRRPIIDSDIVIESAAWSPDGLKFVIAYSNDAVSVDIATVNADGTGFLDLTPDPLPGIYLDRDPAWSPDSKRIAFSSNRSGTTHLWLMNADGSEKTQVIPAATPSNERQPTWSPDGSFIAVVANTSTGPGMTFVRPDGTDLKHVVIAPGPNSPVWMPDGRLVYVANPNGDFDIFSVDRVTSATTPITSRRDNDVHVSILANASPFNWLGFAAPIVNPLGRPAAFDLDAARVVTDSLNDILILSPSLHELRVMRSTGAGGYLSMGALFSESSVIEIATARVSPDALTDIVGRSDSAAYLWVGRLDGPGIAKKIPMNGRLRDQAVFDADANGRFDIVSLVERDSQPFRIVTRSVGADDSAVVVRDQPTQKTNAHRMCAADLTGDALVDLLILNGTQTLTGLLAENRGGTLGFNTLLSLGTSLSTDLNAIPVCADLNGDGKDDLVLVSPNAVSGVSVRLFRTTTFGPATTIAVQPSSVVAVDIDRDGDRDLIIGSSAKAELFIVKNRGDGRFEAPVSVKLNNIPTLIVAADLDGNTWPDVALIDAFGALEVLLSRGRIGM